MKKHLTLTSIIIAFFRTALLLVLLVSIIISTLSVFLRDSIFSKELFIQQITSDQYISEVTEFIDRTIKRKCMAYKLPYYEFRPIITDIKIRDIAKRYANNLYESLTSGTPMEDILYSSDDIFKYLKDYLQNKRIVTSDDDVKFFAEDIAHDITVNIVAINDSYGGVNLIKPLSQYIFNNDFLRTIAKYSDLLVVSCAFLTIITLLLCSADFKSGLFNLASIYWFAGLFMFVPVMYFKNHNVLDGVSIGDTPVKSLINVLAPPIIDSLNTATMIIFITASVIMLYTIALYIGLFIAKRKKVNQDILKYHTETHFYETEENVREKINITTQDSITDDVNELIDSIDNSGTAEDTSTTEVSTSDDINQLTNMDNDNTAENTDTAAVSTTDDINELTNMDNDDTAENTDAAAVSTTDDINELINSIDTAEDTSTAENSPLDDANELIDSIDNSDTAENTDTAEDSTSDDIMRIIADVESKLNY